VIAGACGCGLLGVLSAHHHAGLTVKAASSLDFAFREPSLAVSGATSMFAQKSEICRCCAGRRETSASAPVASCDNRFGQIQITRGTYAEPGAGKTGNSGSRYARIRAIRGRDGAPCFESNEHFASSAIANINGWSIIPIQPTLCAGPRSALLSCRHTRMGSATPAHRQLYAFHRGRDRGSIEMMPSLNLPKSGTISVRSRVIRQRDSGASAHGTLVEVATGLLSEVSPNGGAVR
jgi:hypothetical protein